MKASSLLGVLLLFSGVAMAMPEEKMTMSWSCLDQPVCTAITGPFSLATTKVMGQEFTATGGDSTCCQLAGKIQVQICRMGLESQGVEVTCQ